MIDMIAAMGIAALRDQFLESDVRCASCGYNLRGLRPDGRCPECGADVNPSIWIHLRKEERRPQPPELMSATDPRWVRRLRFGAGISVMVFLLILATSFAPDWAYELKTTPREVMLGIACITWVLSCYAAWKLTTPEPLVTRDGHPTNLALFPKLLGHPAGKRLRICASIYLLGIIILCVPYHRDKPALAWQLIAAPGVIGLFAGLFAAWLYYHHVSRLAWRLGSRGISIQAKILGMINVLVFVFPIVVPELDASEDSLSGITKTPTLAFGAPYQICTTIHWLQDAFVHWITISQLAIFCWSGFIAVWLFVRLMLVKSGAQAVSEIDCASSET